MDHEKRKLSWWISWALIALVVLVLLAIEFQLEVWWHQFMNWWGDS